MENLESSTVKTQRRDIYSRWSSKKTPPENGDSSFVPFDPANFVLIDDAEESSSDDEAGVTPALVAAPKFIPPWRREQINSSTSNERSDKEQNQQPVGAPLPDVSQRHSRMSMRTTAKSNLSCVQEMESVTLSSQILQPRPSNGNLTGVFPLDEPGHDISSLKPINTGGNNKTGELRENPSGLQPRRTGGSASSLKSTQKTTQRSASISEADKENQGSSTTRRLFSEKKKSVSLSVLPAHTTDEQSVHRSNPALRESYSTNSLPQSKQATHRNNPHSDSGCYDLNFCKSTKTTKSIAVQTNNDWKKQILLESAVKSKMRPEVTRQDSSTTSSHTPAVVTVNKKTYTILSLIGRGGSSSVEQVFDFENARRLALKRVSLVGQPPAAVAAFKKEIEMLQKLQFSDKVIQLVDHEFDEASLRLLILLECGETDLAVYLKRRLEDHSLHRMQRCVFWYDMLQAVQVLHQQGIVHSDIKPANFMLVAGEIKLIDFGIARQLDADATSMELESCVGTLNYMSPEVLQGIGSKDLSSKAGRKADVWSLGCILYYMTYGFTPFQSITNFIKKVTAISNPNHIIEIPDVGEPLLTRTIQMCLERDYKKRASIEELLSHPFVR